MVFQAKPNKCLYCRYEWQPREPRPPRRCPYCQTYRWNNAVSAAAYHAKKAVKAK